MDGVGVRYRLPLLQAMTGSQLNPWIEDDRALERYATGGPVRRVRAFAVAFAPSDAPFVEGPIEVSFFELPARGALAREPMNFALLRRAARRSMGESP